LYAIDYLCADIISAVEEDGEAEYEYEKYAEAVYGVV
jgi:hypothetical protein